MYKKGRVFALFLALMLIMAPAFSSYAVDLTDEQTSEQTSAKGESKAGEELGETEEEPKAGEESIDTGDIMFYVMDENGTYLNNSDIKKQDVKSGQTLREAGITLPTVSSSYPGLQFVGWVDKDGKEITEDSPIVFNKQYFAGSPTASAATYWIMDIYAKYDKGAIQVSYMYPNSHGKWRSESDSVVFDYGCTYAELLDDIKAHKPGDMTDQYQFVGWELYSLQKETDVVNGGANKVVEVIAKYKDVNMLWVDYSYITSEGRNNWDRYYAEREFDAVAVKESASVDDVREMLSASVPPETYKGLRFEKWDITEEALLERDRAVNGQQFTRIVLFVISLMIYQTPIRFADCALAFL